MSENQDNDSNHKILCNKISEKITGKIFSEVSPMFESKFTSNHQMRGKKHSFLFSRKFEFD